MTRATMREARRDRVIRLVLLGLVWVVGTGAGLSAIFATTARYGCVRDDPGLACDTSGSILGIALMITVIAIVTVATLLSLGRPGARARVACGVSIAALALCFVAARSLLGTA